MAKEPEQTQTSAVDMTQLAELMKGFATELRKPSDIEQAKIDKEQELELRRKRENLRQYELERQLFEAKWNSCAHVKENGKHNFAGQVHGNGLCKAICQACNWCSDWFEPFPEMLNGGAELRDYNGLTRAAIEQRSAELKAKQAVTV